MSDFLTALTYFAMVVLTLGWGTTARSPTQYAWMVDHIGQTGFLGVFALLWITGGVLLYREKADRAG